MLGFTYTETEKYLRYVLRKYSGSEEQFEEIWQLIVSNYDGYRFSPSGERLFNSTILTYFFKNYAETASIPPELIDENLRTDINWIRRLTLSLTNAKEMLDALVIDDELSYNVSDLSSKFNKKKFFEKEFYPVSLFYLGMTTLKSAYRMVLPNMTMRSIYMDYYNQLNKIEGNASRYVPVYELYDSNRSFEPLVQNYFEQYLGQFPAQVFDKINENFIRCSFYELVSRYLSHCYTFAIEQNNSVGRSDFEMIGIPRHGLLHGRPRGGIQILSFQRCRPHACAHRTAGRTRRASERLCRRYKKEIPQLPCSFVHCVYLCQQRVEVLGGLI